MAATAKQLAALKKARAARAKNLAKSKPKAKPRAKAKPRVKARKRNPTKAERYLVFLRLGQQGRKYYLQKSGKSWVWDTSKPATGMPKQTAVNYGKRYGKTAIAKLPPKGYAVYLEKKR